MPLGASAELGSDNNAHTTPADEHDQEESDEEEEDVLIPRELRNDAFDLTPPAPGRGRLVVALGKSRYMDDAKAKQVSNIETLLKCDSHDNHSQAAGRTTGADDASGGSFLLNPTREHARKPQSLPETMLILWRYYTENLDCMVKVLYKPAVEQMLSDALQDPSQISASTEALLFAILLASVTAMTKEESLQLLKQERDRLRPIYRSAAERALTAAGWMTTQEIVVLQALTLLIVFSPPRQVRSTWLLSGTALSLAQAMGLHSDDSPISLSRAEVEVRRRVWWTLCQISNRISEDCGLEPPVPLAISSRLPLNINDADLANIHPDSIQSRPELTETTLSLFKMEFARLSFRVRRLRYSGSPQNRAEIDMLVQDQIRRYEEVYLPRFTEPTDFHRLCCIGGRLLIAKCWKLTFESSSTNLENRQTQFEEKMFTYNIDLLEILHHLPDRYRPHGWFFRCKYTQWHAMAYLLVQLQRGISHSSEVDRAWSVIDMVFDSLEKEHGDISSRSSSHGRTKESMKWRLFQAMQRVYVRIRKMRTDAPASSNNASPDSGYDSTVLSQDEHIFEPMAPTDGLLGDPFLGPSSDFGQEMNWGELDAWVQALDTGNDLFQSGGMDLQTGDFNPPFSFW
ncbi:hypothetical protein BDV96DRAFT_652826 [Lophiotrema nucula]|uniref:Xylanolytic transcriptional activator regulatory domain-containing protein n=1 Tax=Lophiotrema nucula TaxID=690887 RepID=A0A6A5YPE5_9PLEO|nr:hypothetical protein BDV96DRAFT_652826 [Lophiotrema nucula]